LRKRLAIPSGADVLLTAHPSLTGIASGSGLSGSTAWNASVRSRLYFKRLNDEDDTEPDPDLRVLEVMKLNYGRAGEALTLKWRNGLFLPVSGAGGFEQAAKDQAAEHLFLSLLDRFTKQGTNISPVRFARNYAAAVFAKEKQAKDARLRKRDLETAMDRLFEAGKIDKQEYGYASRKALRIVRT
jgi:RecA-family ATPase